MKNFAKKVGVLLGATFFLTVFSTASALSLLPSGEPVISTSVTAFSDVDAKYPYKGSIEYLQSIGSIQGYADGTYKPEQTISRAEFMKVLIASVEANPSGTNCFPDVKNQWFAKYVCTAKRLGMVKGYKDGTFRPGRNISFAEASKIVAHAFHYRADAAPGAQWYKPYVNFLESHKAIPASIDYADKKLTRGDLAELVVRLRKGITDRPTKTFASLTASFPTIASCAELKEKFDLQATKRGRYQYGILEESIAMPRTLSSQMSAKSEASGTSGAASDYSSTNVQVEGVDEGDVVKNDGEYIYLVKGQSVRIVKAYPADSLSETAKINYSGTAFDPQEIYISGTKLVVVGRTWVEGSRTKVFIYDVSDHAAPKEVRNFIFDGDYVSSRLIGDRVYLVANDHPDVYRILQNENPEPLEEKLTPQFFDSKTGEEKPMAGCSEIRYYPRFSEPNYLIVASFSLESENSSVNREVFMGMGGTVYSSLENLYVAAPKNDFDENVRYSIWQPTVLNENTILYRFQLNNGNVEYKGQGTVPGRLLNQFSMDERNGAFRVATTKGQVWNSQNLSTNHLFILDVNNLGNVLGKIENIAPGERIYSVRFLGDRAYMVTFKKVDPFFVIDVSNSSSPKILGELKIPGYSDYLHPFDENHIIGFGKEAVDPTELEKSGFNNDAFDFAWYQGMKIALFDVTDVANPKLKFKEVIGDRGTDSELLRNHKALLYDKARTLFAFPAMVYEISAENKTELRGDTYGEPVFQGAYVYTLNLENGFQLKGKITHIENAGGLAEQPITKAGNLFEQDNQIQRILFMGDTLYTVSPGKVKATLRENMQLQNSVTLEKSGSPDEPPIVY